MERRWIILIGTIGLIMATLIVGLLIHASFRRDICMDAVCQSPECVQSAAQILNYLDYDVKPCDNFYEFVCGKFLRTVDIPDDMDKISTNTIVTDELQKQLKSAFEEPPELSEMNAFRLLKTFYRACTDTETIERRGVKVLHDLLKGMGGWPVLEDQTWEYQNLDWYYYVFRFKELGLDTSHLLDLDVQNDFKNTTFHILQFGQPKLSLPREFFLDETQNEYLEEYRKYMVNVAVYLGADDFRATIELRDSLRFEMKLAEIMVSSESMENVTNLYNIMTIHDLERQYSTIPWLEYINNLISPHYQVTTHERILVLVPAYIEQLEELLERTSRRDQINYLVWRVISSIIPYLTEDLREMEFNYRTGTSGILQKPPRWKECVEETYKSFPLEVSSLYIRKFFDEDIKVDAEEILRSVKQEYVNAIEKVEWMDKKTRQKAIDKAYAIEHIIGYPDELLDDDKIEEIHKGLEVFSKQYLKSHLNINSMNVNLKFKRLRMLKDKVDWIYHGTIAAVDAFYTRLTNSITLSAGLLQVPSYISKHRPNYLNFGGLGYAIAHEITHAFDDTGKLFDKDGNMHDWWDAKTEMYYLEKTACILDQYSNYTVTEINQTIDEVKTLGDNIADNIGLKHAYHAYMTWVRQHGEEQKLPGLVYTPRQLFWIAFALNQCSRQRPARLLLDMATNEHSPSEFRVVGPVSNLREFAEDYDCTKDSPMYPKNNCTFW